MGEQISNYLPRKNALKHKGNVFWVKKLPKLDI